MFSKPVSGVTWYGFKRSKTKQNALFLELVPVYWVRISKGEAKNIYFLCKHRWWFLGSGKFGKCWRIFPSTVASAGRKMVEMRQIPVPFHTLVEEDEPWRGEGDVRYHLFWGCDSKRRHLSILSTPILTPSYHLCVCWIFHLDTNKHPLLDVWTQCRKERVGWIEKVASKYILCRV